MIVALLGSMVLAAEGDAERQFRQIQLVDGRTLVGEILATRPEGMAIALPQGEMSLSYELLLDMVPVEEAAFNQQDPWLVLLVARPDSAIAQYMAAIPSVVVWTPMGVVGAPGTPIDLTETEQAALKGCAGAAACMKGALGSAASWRWIVTLTGGEGDTATILHGAISTGDTTTKAVLPSDSADAAWAAAFEVLNLVPPKSGSPLASIKTRSSGSSAQAFSPLPGYPALAAGDSGRFALALGVAIPATAAWVGVVGTHAESLPEHAALGLVGFYAITVLTNELVSPRDGKSRK